MVALASQFHKGEVRLLPSDHKELIVITCLASGHLSLNRLK